MLVLKRRFCFFAVLGRKSPFLKVKRKKHFFVFFFIATDLIKLYIGIEIIKSPLYVVFLGKLEFLKCQKHKTKYKYISHRH